jgi:hypothetical protein
MTVRALSRASDADAVIVGLESTGERMRWPRFWETEDGIVDVETLFLKLKGRGTAGDAAARARLLEIVDELLDAGALTD